MNQVDAGFISQIHDSNFTFPKDKQQKNEFLTNIGRVFEEINDASLVEIEKFHERVIELVPTDVVEEGERIALSFPVRFHLWSKKHPILGVIVKILSLGLLAIVGYIGKKRLSRPSCKAHLDQIAIAKKVEQRKTFLSGVKDKNLEQMPLAERQTFVALVVRDKEGLEATVFEGMKDNIKYNAESDLNSPVTWRTERNVETLQAIYTNMDCLELHEIVSERWKLLSQVRKWSDLSDEDKKDLIDELEELPLPKRAELISFLVKNEISSQTQFSSDIGKRLKENAENELRSTDLWKNKEDVEALIFIYSLTKCAQLEGKVTERYNYLTYVRGWDQFTQNSQKENIDELVQMPIQKRAELISFLVDIEDDIDSLFFQDLSVKVQGSVKEELSSPDLYFDGNDLIALQRIYSVLECEDADKIVAERRVLIQKIQNWENISIQERLGLLDKLIAERKIFEAQLIAICYEFKAGFTFNELLSLSENDTEYSFKMFNSICELNLELDLKGDLEAIEDGIRVKHLIEAYRENNEDKVDKIILLCEVFNFDIATLHELLETLYEESDFSWEVSDEKIQDHKKLLSEMIANENIFGKELDVVRQSIFKEIPLLRKLNIKDARAVISELLMLKFVFKEGIKQQIMKAQIEVLHIARDEGFWEKGQEESRAVLQEMCEALSFDKEFIHIFDDSKREFYDFSEDDDYRIKEVNYLVSKICYDLRCMGIPTDPEGILEFLSLSSLKFSPYQKTTKPPELKKFEGEVNILNLLELLKNVPEDVIPMTITEPDGGKNLQVSDVLKRLDASFKDLQLESNGEKESGVLNILRHYTQQVEQRLASANRKEKIEIYLEIKQYILEIMGPSVYHCPDRLFNAAKVILREQITTGQVDLSTPELVNNWIPERLDEYLTQMLIELIKERNPDNPDRDVASPVGYWKNFFQDEFNLGAVPKPAHDLKGGLEESEIRSRFKQFNTPEMILDLAMEEYGKDHAHIALRFDTINTFLENRFENYYTELADELFDEEDFKLKREAMALYLQECGVFPLESDFFW